MTDNDQATSLGTEFPKMQAHCRELLQTYRDIGAAGVFGATMIEQTLREADAAAISGDVVEMLRVYKKMKDHK